MRVLPRCLLVLWSMAGLVACEGVGEGPTRADPGLEQATREPAREAELRVALAAMQERGAGEFPAAEQRVQALLEADAAGPPGARVTDEQRAAALVQLAIPAIGRGERERANGLLVAALQALDAADGARLDASGQRTGSPPQDGRLREQAHRLLGNFVEAHQGVWRRHKRAEQKVEAAETAEDLRDRLELGVLAKVCGSSWDFEAAFKDSKPEVTAVLKGYQALDFVCSGSRARALEALEVAEAAAREVRDPSWNFQTLGRPFPGLDRHEGCGSRYFESLRRSTFPKASANYLVGPLLGLRLCILALPPDPT